MPQVEIDLEGGDNNAGAGVSRNRSARRPSTTSAQRDQHLPQQPPRPAREGAEESEQSFGAIYRQIVGQNPEVRSVVDGFEKYIPFLVLILCKVIFDHGLGTKDTTYARTLSGFTVFRSFPIQVW